MQAIVHGMSCLESLKIVRQRTSVTVCGTLTCIVSTCIVPLSGRCTTKGIVCAETVVGWCRQVADLAALLFCLPRRVDEIDSFNARDHDVQPAPLRVVSNRNQVRRSASSMKFSSRL